MTNERAFSDTEIVTIALVAASALGGIVIGLGRGGERDRDRASDSHRVRDTVTRALESGSTLVPSRPNVGMPGGIERVVDRYRDLSLPEARSVVDRATEQIEKRPGIDSVRARVPSRDSGRPSSLGDSLRSLGASILEAGLAGSPEIDLEQLRSEVLTKLSRPSIGDDDESKVSKAGRLGIVDRLGDDLKAVEEGVSSAPAAARSVQKRTGRVLRRRVASPVVNAASSAGDVTKETLAALAWLGLGTLVVYFGLLSDQRREQVKDALCAGIEQARLLMLDFQGYEPEM